MEGKEIKEMIERVKNGVAVIFILGLLALAIVVYSGG